MASRRNSRPGAFGGGSTDVIIASASRLQDAVERYAPVMVLEGRASRRRLTASGYFGAHRSASVAEGAAPCRAHRLSSGGRQRLSPVGRRRLGSHSTAHTRTDHPPIGVGAGASSRHYCGTRGARGRG